MKIANDRDAAPTIQPVPLGNWIVMRRIVERLFTETHRLSRAAREDKAVRVVIDLVEELDEALGIIEPWPIGSEIERLERLLARARSAASPPASKEAASA